MVVPREAAGNCRDQLYKVLSSDAFQGSVASRKLLEYLGERTLEGETDGLKEYTIGVEALGRSEGYDPQVDPSVRVQVSRLRKRLARYYQDEGANDAVRMDLPKGQFAVRFLTSEQEPPAPETRGKGLNPPPAADSSTGWRRLSFALAAAVVALGGYLTLGSGPVASTPSELTPEMRQFWRPYIESNLPSTLSLGVAMFVRVPGEDPALTTYLRQSGVNNWPAGEQVPGLSELRAAIGGVDSPDAVYTYCGVGEAVGAYLVGQNLKLAGVDVPIVRSSVLSWDEVKASNLIFVGPPKFNRQIEAGAYERNFRVVHEGIENIQPLDGEQPFYREEVRDGDLRSVHAVISRFPNGSGTGVVTVFASNDGAGTWGGVEYVTRPELAGQLVESIRLPDGSLPGSFEILVRARCDQDYPVDVSYVAHRAY